VYIPYENPLDRYFLHHPAEFLGKQRERIVIQPDNPRLAAWHLTCAAAELPLRPEEVSPKEGSLLDELVANAILTKTPRGMIYRGRKRAHEILSMDSIAGEGIRLTCEGKLLETMDPLRARRDAYPGAILLHRGETYVVEDLKLEEGVARLRQEKVDYYTKSMRTSVVKLLAVQEAHSCRSIVIERGRTQVTESFVGYKTIHFDRTISVDALDLPAHTYETDALWITFPVAIDGIPSEKLLGGLHGAEHALIAMAPLLVLCERDDIDGVSTPLHEETGLPTILIFDEIEGGAGLAEVLFTSLHRLATEALKLVSDCPCENGCPSCIYSPRCGSHNRPLDKEATIRVLRLLGEETVS